MKLIRFSSLLLLALVTACGLHLAYFYANGKMIRPDEWLISYGINLVLAIIIYAVMLELAKRKSPYLGFFFLFGSAFKFAAYFLVIDPLLRRDGALSYADFFLFFIPYLVSLIAETLAVIKLLKQGDSDRSS